jgi:hypothetical protein
MPVPKPKKGEKRNSFISRCISRLSDTDPDRPKKQRIGMCYSAWRQTGRKAPKPKKKRTGSRRSRTKVTMGAT